MKYSPSTGQSYHPDCNYAEEIPDDVVELTESDHRALVNSRAAGAAVEIVDGDVVIYARPPATMTEKRGLAVHSIKSEALHRITRVFPIEAQMNAVRLGLTNDPRFAFIDSVRAASNLIEQDMQKCCDPEQYPVADNPLWPESI